MSEPEEPTPVVAPEHVDMNIGGHPEWAASFALYEDANRRGVALWHVSGGDPDVWPDQAKLVAWLLSERDRLEKYVGWLNATLAELRGAGSAGSPEGKNTIDEMSDEECGHIMGHLLGLGMTTGYRRADYDWFRGALRKYFEQRGAASPSSGEPTPPTDGD
jgi:hypothetical protein